ncbi:hypothetical protein RSPO_m00168 (plasmid) [Ralstonia solanacearum Po82]|uniref:Uncharacterized protein n=1 Tax=Ralstonia solanacearum (strain Po82) TaxID=1031711 RepID=F6G858_RALS8|nr:hypothetical protein RSPO_m00168 [Ralstonia solanacearum Po82]
MSGGVSGAGGWGRIIASDCAMPYAKKCNAGGFYVAKNN